MRVGFRLHLSDASLSIFPSQLRKAAVLREKYGVCESSCDRSGAVGM
jgi:hypothetical protein